MARVKLTGILLVCWIVLGAISPWLWQEKQEIVEDQRVLGWTSLISEVLGESKSLASQYLYSKLAVDFEGSENMSEGIPMMQLLVILDPSFTEIYDQIAYTIQKVYYDDERALKVAKEGLYQNPKSYLLHLRAAMIYDKQEKLEQAYEHALKAYLYADDLRGVRNVADESTNMWNALRLMYGIRRKQGSTDGMKEVLLTWLQQGGEKGRNAAMMRLQRDFPGMTIEELEKGLK